MSSQPKPHFWSAPDSRLYDDTDEQHQRIYESEVEYDSGFSGDYQRIYEDADQVDPSRCSALTILSNFTQATKNFIAGEVYNIKSVSGSDPTIEHAEGDVALTSGRGTDWELNTRKYAENSLAGYGGSATIFSADIWIEGASNSDDSLEPLINCGYKLQGFQIGGKDWYRNPTNTSYIQWSTTHSAWVVSRGNGDFAFNSIGSDDTDQPWEVLEWVHHSSHGWFEASSGDFKVHKS